MTSTDTNTSSHKVHQLKELRDLADDLHKAAARIWDSRNPSHDEIERAKTFGFIADMIYSRDWV